ncbi:MAG: hypothetical protein HQK54_15095 [Oligoflexales bacterium]|nr:hypothetical protein [Oligoflexales bacterium]
MEISINIQQDGQWDLIKYMGPINEEAEVHLSKLLPNLGKNVVFNLGGVQSINSCGVRGWINFMRDAQKGRNIIFEECTSECVLQMNMIPSFRGNAKIKSVYATYSCESCTYQTSVLFVDGRNLPTSQDFELEPVICPKCGEGMEMLEIEEEFFSFLGG